MLFRPARDLQLGRKETLDCRDFRREGNAVVAANVNVAQKASRNDEGDHI